MRRALASVVVLALGACTPGTRATFADRVERIEAAFEDAAQRTTRVVTERVVPPEPLTLRRREVVVGQRWGREGHLLERAADLLASRIDLEALPRGTAVSVWTLGDDVIAAEVHRDKADGGPLIAVPAFTGRDRIIRHYDEHGVAIDGPFVSRPLEYHYISSRFGPRMHPFSGKRRLHRGIDFSAPRGTDVVSVGDGVVVVAAENASAGLHVVVRHKRGLRTKYFHLDAFAEGLAPGARVKRGQLLGVVGATGATTGPHLHFEVVRAGALTDPTRLEWPGGAKLPKKARAAHKELAARLRAMTEEDAVLSWQTPTAVDGSARRPS